MAFDCTLPARLHPAFTERNAIKQIHSKAVLVVDMKFSSVVPMSDNSVWHKMGARSRWSRKFEE